MGYSVTTWGKVRADYESGNFSADKLHQKYAISREAIIKNMVKNKWVKGKNKPAIIQGIAERNIAMFEKLGMTQEKVAELIKKGMEDDSEKALQYKYMQEFIKMCGTYAPQQREISGKGGTELFGKGATREELANAIKGITGRAK